MTDRAKNLVHFELKSYVGVMGMFAKKPLHTVALALYLICWHGVRSRPKPGAKVRTWIRLRETLAEQAHDLRNREGMPPRENDMRRSREMTAIYEELETRERQKVYPFDDVGGA